MPSSDEEDNNSKSMYMEHDIIIQQVGEKEKNVIWSSEKI